MSGPRSVEELLRHARGDVARVDPADLAAEMSAGALVVDTRPIEQRLRDGELPGAVIVDRNVLEWRLEPTSPHRIKEATGGDQRIIVVCNEGYSSSLAAATLRAIGLHRATDLVGGFQAWRATQHWNKVYSDKPADEMSWYQRQPETSLRLIAAAATAPAAVIDIGAGTSTLTDALLERGWTDLTVLDISTEARAAVRSRLGDRVKTIVADVLAWTPTRAYDVWHDRALFHFLTQPLDRERYAAAATAAVRPGGALVVGTFAADGAQQCSGLPTARYDAAGLAAALAPTFILERSEREEHVTPGGHVQPFTWAVLRRTP
jgi:rhodanese-related sulfurtransferase